MSKLKFTILGFMAAALLAGCGGSSSDPLPFPEPITPIARFNSYLVNADLDGALGVNSVDPVSGRLTRVNGSPFATSTSTINVAVHPNGQLIYAGSDASDLLQGFSLAPVTGGLTQIGGFPITSSLEGTPVFDPTGEYLYVVGEVDIDAFRVNATTGGLTRLAGFPQAVPGLLAATQVKFNNAGTRVYVPDTGSDQIFVFARNTNTGNLTLLENLPSGADEPIGIGLTPDEDFLYLAHEDGNLTGFDVEGDGTLTALAGFPVAYAAGPSLCYGMAFVDDVVFVSDAFGDLLNAFDIGPAGGLTQTPGYPVAGGGAEVYLFPSPFQNILYLPNTQDNLINAYIVNEDESVTPVVGSPFQGSGAPSGLGGSVVTY